jgi:tellurite methyltransferase
MSPIIAPSTFVVEWLARAARLVPPDGRALDVAMGRGRHAVLLADAGFRTFGVDVKLDAVKDAVAAGALIDRSILGWCADLTEHPLPRSRFDLIVVTRYLQRDLFESIGAALTPGGIVLYETFTTLQRALGSGPTSPDHLLEPGELERRFEKLEVLFYEETSAPEAVARLAARSLRSEV